VLAGVPIAGRLAFANDGTTLAGSAAGTLPHASATLDVAGARVVASGRLDSAASGARDHWDVDAQGADLARLAPLLRLATDALPALAGRVDAQASVDGRWPALVTSGSAKLAEARFGELQLAAGRARWHLGSTPQAPLELTADVRELRQSGAGEPQRTLARAQLHVEGTLAAHRLTLDAASPAQPPAWLDVLSAEAPPASRETTPPATQGSALELKAQGSLDVDAAGSGPLQWRGQVQRLALRPGAPAKAPPWLAMNDVGLELRYDRAAARPSVALAPGRLQLPGGALRWTRLAWQGGARPVLDAQAELEPVAVAPLLARLQPDFGWRGDLVVAGRLDVRSAPRFEAAVEIVRQRGDLSVSDAAGTLALGLSDLRLALDARDGVWSFTQAFAGKTLGAMAAAATVRTDPGRLWPSADAPLSGVLEATVANLGAWGAWVPAGWRLGGRLHASASIGGRFGAPQYTGQVEGSGLGARNLLEGIDLHDGVLALRLQGETAHIEKFEAHAGDGRVAVSGGAVFGATPTARLDLVAEHALVLGRVDRRIVASGQAKLQLQADSIRLDGAFKVDEGLIDISRASAPQLGDDVRVVRAGTGADTANAPAASGRRLALDLALDLGPQLRMRGRGIDTLLRGQLALSAPAGKLALSGSVRTAEGHYAAYGQKLDVERGVIAFSGAPDNPRLDIVAVRPDLDVRVGVAISGTAQSPRVRLFSEPEMAEIDKLSWLVLGRATDGLGGNDVALLQRAALGLLAGERGSPTSDLTHRLGLDDLSLRQSDGEVRETVVSLGKQLTRRWYVGYERSLNATAGTWQLIYRIAQRFTLRAQSGLDNSLDLIWTWRWQ
jgi:translocation and assembly module TamB